MHWLQKSNISLLLFTQNFQDSSEILSFKHNDSTIKGIELIDIV